MPPELTCGVTVSSSTASRNWTVTVLFATTCTGKVTPCLIVAGRAFCATIRGAERIVTSPFRSAALRAMSRCAAPPRAPMAIPSAPAGAPLIGRSTP